MSTPFLGEIRMLSFNYPPKGWSFCNGQLLAINQNQALFSILGTTYGGDGRTTFALPDLRSRVPVHVGNGISLGQQAGEENHTVLLSEMPTHNHLAAGNAGAPNSVTPGNNYWGAGGQIFAASANSTMAPNALPNAGGSQPHTNLQPYLVISFAIALQGIFPSRS
ncbi:MAG: tail fiber protein [Chthoniobacteraceae bacterium]